MSKEKEFNIEDLIKKVKGKTRVDVRRHSRQFGLTPVEAYHKYIEKKEKEEKEKKIEKKKLEDDEETINIDEELDEKDLEDINPEIQTIDTEDEDYDDDVELPLTEQEKAILPKDDRSIEELISSWKSKGDEESLRQIFKIYGGIIYYHANKYKTSSIPYPLIVLQAKLLTIKALNSFNPEKKAAFNTHLTNYLKKLYRFIGENQNIAKIPEQRIRKINDYKNALAKLEDILEREPTEAELSDELSWSTREVTRLKNELGRAEIMQFGEDYSYSDLGIFSEKTPETIKLIYIDSSPNEKYIMEHTYNFSGKKQMTIREISKSLGISEAKVKYIISEIRKKVVENM